MGCDLQLPRRHAWVGQCQVRDALSLSVAEACAAGEYDRRIYRQLADQITQILRREKAEGWSFAAPSEIYPHIVDLLPRDVREQIVEHVKSDLVKIEPAKLPAHFRSLRPI